MRLAISLVMLSSLLATQPIARPDFSGTWSVDATKQTSVGGGQGGGRGTGGGLGLGPSADSIVIRQNADTLTADEHRGTDMATIAYRFDGKAVTNTMPAGRNAGKPATYVTHWDGDAIVTVIDAPGAPGSTDRVHYQEKRTVDQTGAMILETSIPGQDNVRRVVYTRKPSGV